MRTIRSIYRSLLLLALLVAAVIDGHLRRLIFGMKPGAEGAIWVSRWCRRILRALQVDARVSGVVPRADERGLVVVSNHLSYLDILVYSAAAPFIMVSKSEVRGWPLLGWITAQAGTIYVERADVKGGQQQTHAEVNAMMAHGFESGLPVLFYPEGTTTDGATVLPFRRGLFNSVVAHGVPVRAAALSYSLKRPHHTASVANDVCYWGSMVFGPHLFRALGLGGLQVNVSFGSQTVAGGNRFTLALHARDHVIEQYEAISGVSGIARQVAFPSQQREHLFDRPVERVAPIYGEAGVSG